MIVSIEGAKSLNHHFLQYPKNQQNKAGIRAFAKDSPC